MILSKKLNKESGNEDATNDANGSGNLAEASTDSDKIISE